MSDRVAVSYSQEEFAALIDLRAAALLLGRTRETWPVMSAELAAVLRLIVSSSTVLETSPTATFKQAEPSEASCQLFSRGFCSCDLCRFP